MTIHIEIPKVKFVTKNKQDIELQDFPDEVLAEAIFDLWEDQAVRNTVVYWELLREAHRRNANNEGTIVVYDPVKKDEENE